MRQAEDKRQERFQESDDCHCDFDGSRIGRYTVVFRCDDRENDPGQNRRAYTEQRK